jgi:hypothetical protein
MTLLDGCKALALVSFAVLCGAVSYLAWVTTQTEKQLAVQASAVFGHIELTLDNLDVSTLMLDASLANASNDITQTRVAVSGVTARLDKTIDLINAKCPPNDGTIQTVDGDKGCGLLANVNTTLRTMRGAIGQVEIAGRNFDKNEATFYSQETTLFTQASAAIEGFNKLVNSKDLADAISNGARITGNVNGITSDFEVKFHDFLYPPKCVGKMCFIKKAIPYIKLAAGVPEPAYYGYQLWKAAH